MPYDHVRSLIDPQEYFTSGNTGTNEAIPEFKVVEGRVQFIVFPSLVCPECRFQMYVTSPDQGIRVFIDHPYNDYCSRSLERVIRPVTDFYKEV